MPVTFKKIVLSMFILLVTYMCETFSMQNGVIIYCVLGNAARIGAHAVRVWLYCAILVRKSKESDSPFSRYGNVSCMCVHVMFSSLYLSALHIMTV